MRTYVTYSLTVRVEMSVYLLAYLLTTATSQRRLRLYNVATLRVTFQVPASKNSQKSLEQPISPPT